MGSWTNNGRGGSSVKDEVDRLRTLESLILILLV